MRMMAVTDQTLSGGISSGQKVRTDFYRDKQDRPETGDGRENLTPRETRSNKQIPLIHHSHHAVVEKFY